MTFLLLVPTNCREEMKSRNCLLLMSKGGARYTFSAKTMDEKQSEAK